MNTIKWLHLSDFHVGLDNYGQTQLFQYIINHIKEKIKNGKLDFIFITGDIAQSGIKEEYDKFEDEFILPLEEIIGKECKIFAVTGNHDVDRNKQKFFSRDEILVTTEFFDPTKKGFDNRQNILQRFSAFSKLYQPFLTADWINSENGYFVYNHKLKGVDLGILGINTAWLSKDGKDEGNITAGKAIVEKGLAEIKDCNVKLVLGHHPINWFYDEEPTRSLFAKNQVIYLHGHLHKGSSRYEEGAGHQFLAIQSGAAFQGREEDIWVNGLLWGELNFKSETIQLEPYKWKREHYGWCLDSDAFPETFRNGGVWALPLPKKITSLKPNIKVQKPFSVPLGWKVIDLADLNKERNEPDTSTILKYFDGRIPNWALALSKQIPRRKIVAELATEINNAANITQRSTITILLGAGGEGKSTAFLQTIAAILETDNNWKVLFHDDENSKLSPNIIKNLPQDYKWLIASDDADLISEDLFNAAFSCQSQCSNVHLLLAARDTDWCSAKIEPSKWESTFNKTYREKRLLGLIEEDAKKIVEAWANYQDDGLGKLADLSIEQATQRLLDESKSEVKDGAFFGALLRVRYGDALKSHIKKLLDRLKERPIMDGNKYNLLDAFSYIAAMHSENQLFLSKLVLAHVLKVELGQLRAKVLYPLGEEAAASMAGEYVFTRHRAIAETAMQILEEEMFYGIDPDDIYIELVTAAESLCQRAYFVPNLEKWRYLSDHFFEQKNHSLAIRLTQNLLSLDRGNSHLRVKLAQEFRKAGRPELATQTFRDAPMSNEIRGFFSEWGLSERNEGNHALTVYLIGYALSDESVRKPPDNEDAKICFGDLSHACQELFKKYNNYIFIEACSATAQLGLSVSFLDEKNKSKLRKIRQFALENGIREISIPVALKRVQEAIIEAYNKREVDIPSWLIKAEDLHFQGLKDLLNIR
jgi:hypothetical protein